jgi:uncharacterized protein DUF4229
VKEFTVYTALRVLLFLVCYGVFAGLWALAWGQSDGLLVWPFIAAIVVSSLLSLRYLRGPRERFAQRVQERAARATERFEEIRAREDAAQDAAREAAQDVDQKA